MIAFAKLYLRSMSVMDFVNDGLMWVFVKLFFIYSLFFRVNIKFGGKPVG